MNFEDILFREPLIPVNDSRKVVPGCVFCAIRGAKSDGNAFVPAAVKGGADCIVSDREFPGLNVPVVVVPDPYRAWAILCEVAAGAPASHLRMHAVTGTNGKTTIAFLLRKLLNCRCGLISTVEIDTGKGAIPSAHTTPDAAGFQQIVSEMAANHLTDCVMELSSHGLHQHRTGSARFATAVFTNLTGDHLDYHHTMEAYYQAKKILFAELSEGARIINTDDPYGRRLHQECGGFSVSMKEPSADCFLSQIRGTAEGTVFRMRFADTELEYSSPLIGLHNVYNAAEAMAAAISMGVSPKQVQKIMAEPFAVPGRLERIALPNGASAYVDYAHTDDALQRVLAALRPLCLGRLICVFGCGGDRDRTKRPRMAKAVAEAADYAVVTSDNPRSEDPLAILAEIRTGFPESFPREEEPDRAKAILRAAELARPDDLILVAGKGHETTQEISGVLHPFDDREILRSLQHSGKE